MSTPGSPTSTRAATLSVNRSNPEVFADTLEALAEDDPLLTIVTSDSRGSGKLSGFASRRADRMIEIGIAEQNLVAVSAGLVAGGRNVFAVSPASFLVTRSLEQVKHDVCYSDRAVTLVGISAGVSYGSLGSTHHSLHDFAALRAIHNIIVVAPADNWETEQAVRAASASAIPVYLRFGKKGLPDLPNPHDFEFGRARVLRTGTDGLFVATGETSWRAFAAAELLSAEGYSIGVLNMHTVKPLDTSALLDACRSVRAVVTVEEHSVNGGLGEACAHTLLQEGVVPQFRIVGIPDEYTITGSQDEILNHYGISVDGLSITMRSMLDQVR